MPTITPETDPAQATRDLGPRAADQVRTSQTRTRALTDYVEGHTAEHVDVVITPGVDTGAVLPATEDALLDADTAEFAPDEARALIEHVDGDYLVLVTAQAANTDRLPIGDQLTADRAMQFGLAFHELLHILYTAIGDIAALVTDEVDDVHHDQVHDLINIGEDGAIEHQGRAAYSTNAADRLELTRRLFSQVPDDIPDGEQVGFTVWDAITTAFHEYAIYETGVTDVLTDPDDDRLVFAGDAATDAFDAVDPALQACAADVLDLPDSVARAERVIDLWETELKPILDTTADQQAASANSPSSPTSSPSPSPDSAAELTPDADSTHANDAAPQSSADSETPPTSDTASQSSAAPDAAPERDADPDTQSETAGDSRADTQSAPQSQANGDRQDSASDAGADDAAAAAGGEDGESAPREPATATAPPPDARSEIDPSDLTVARDATDDPFQNIFEQPDIGEQRAADALDDHRADETDGSAGVHAADAASATDADDSRDGTPEPAPAAEAPDGTHKRDADTDTADGSDVRNGSNTTVEPESGTSGEAGSQPDIDGQNGTPASSETDPTTDASPSAEPQQSGTDATSTGDETESASNADAGSTAPDATEGPSTADAESTTPDNDARDTGSSTTNTPDTGQLSLGDFGSSDDSETAADEESDSATSDTESGAAAKRNTPADDSESAPDKSGDSSSSEASADRDADRSEPGDETAQESTTAPTSTGDDGPADDRPPSAQHAPDSPGAEPTGAADNETPAADDADGAPARSDSHLDGESLPTDRAAAHDEADRVTPDLQALEDELRDLTRALAADTERDGDSGTASDPDTAQHQQTGQQGGPGSLDSLRVLPLADERVPPHRWVAIERNAEQVGDTLAKYLALDRQGATRSGLTAGSLDARQLDQLGLGDPRGFTVDLPGDDKRYDLVIVLDRSGSMANGSPAKIRTATEAVTRFAIAAEDLRINVAVIDFYQNEARLVKPFSTDIKHAAAGLLSEATGGGTPLADALTLGRGLLDRRHHEPLLLVITDGKPHSVDAVQAQCTRSYAPICTLSIATDCQDGNPPYEATQLEATYDRHLYVYHPDQLDGRLDQFASLFAGL